MWNESKEKKLGLYAPAHDGLAVLLLLGHGGCGVEGSEAAWRVESEGWRMRETGEQKARIQSSSRG